MKEPVMRAWRCRVLMGLHCALSLTLAGCGGDEYSGTAAERAVAMDNGGRPHARVVVQGNWVTLTPVAATASESERGDLSPAAAIDHDRATRWSSGFSDNQFLVLDFGKSVGLHRVRIEWERAHATQYLLQVSDDNTRWTTIKQVDDSLGGVEDWTGLSGQGRYLRVQGVSRVSLYGYSIFEIQAFSVAPTEPAPRPDPPVLPRAVQNRSNSTGDPT